MHELRPEATQPTFHRGAELTFRLIELALADSGVRGRPLPVIQFVVDGAPWAFDTRGHGELFTPGQHPRPTLTLSVHLSLLIRLLVDDDFSVGRDDHFEASGDLDALDALAACFRDPDNVLSIRALRGTP